MIKWVCYPMYTRTNPWGKVKWPYAITGLTAHFMCGLMFDLVFCNFRKSTVIHDTECPYLDQVSLSKTKPNQNQTIPTFFGNAHLIPDGLVVRIWRSHRHGWGFWEPLWRNWSLWPRQLLSQGVKHNTKSEEQELLQQVHQIQHVQWISNISLLERLVSSHS